MDGKTALSTPVGHSGLPENPGATGLPETPGAVSLEENSLEHARWTSKASRKSNSSSYCKASKAVFAKRLSCVAQVTQGAYIDEVFLFSPQNTGSLSTEHQMQTLNIFRKRWNPYTPSRTRFSNGLAYNMSNVSVTFSQIGFVHRNF